MAASAAFGYYLKWDSDRKDRIGQQIQAANERGVEEIQARINLKMEWMKITNLAIKDMRKTRELTVLACRYHHSPTSYQQSVSRFNVRYEVAKSFDGIRFIFNSEIQNKFIELTAFDESVDDVCSPKAPSDEKWHKLASAVDELMENSIEVDQVNLEKLRL